MHEAFGDPSTAVKIIADMHMHVYPCHDAAASMGNLLDNLARLCPTALRAAFLAERSDCDWFASLTSDAPGSIPGFTVRTCGNHDCVLLHRKEGEQLYVFAGRQIATAERVEILSLTSSALIPDGLPIAQAAALVMEAGGVPCLGWAPGKWSFRRHRVVEEMIAEFGRRLLIGDTSLRPTIWPEPDLMKRAGALGIGIVAGSDPLPFPGEERWSGTYTTLIEGEFDDTRPVTSMRTLLTGTGADLSRCGTRAGPSAVAYRLLRNMLVN